MSPGSAGRTTARPHKVGLLRYLRNEAFLLTAITPNSPVAQSSRTDGSGTLAVCCTTGGATGATGGGAVTWFERLRLVRFARCVGCVVAVSLVCDSDVSGGIMLNGSTR